MTIIAPGYNVEGNPAAGFVKNDGAGNFLFSQVGGGGGGGGGAGGGAWELVEVKTVGTAVTSVSFTGLDGDTDDRYLLLYRINKRTASASGNVTYQLRPNGSSSGIATVGQFSVHPTGTTGANTYSYIRLAGGGTVAFDIDYYGSVTIDARTGALGRSFRTSHVSNTRSGFGTFTLWELASDWSDNSTNITSLDIVSTEANTIEVGSQFCLYKKVGAVAEVEGWQLIETKQIVSDATTVTFSGLDGDVDKTYMMQYNFKNPSATIGRYRLEPNGISTNMRTILVQHRANGVQATSDFPLLRIAVGSDGNNVMGRFIFDARTGVSTRQMFNDNSEIDLDIIANAAGFRRNTLASYWLEDTINITSFDVVCDLALGIGIGTRLSLYKMKS